MTLLERARDLATKHVALTVSLSLAVLVVLRALYFARFDLPVAFVVLTLTNQATLLITTLALFLVVGLPVVWVFDPGGHVNRVHEAGTPRAIVLGTTIAVTALLPLIFGSFMTPIFVLIAVIGVIVGKIWRARRRKPRHGAWALGLAIGTSVVVLLGLPWMPSEQITTTSSGDTVVGYVVGEQAGQLLLLDRSRKPVWIKVSDTATREMCEISTLPPDLRWITTPVNRLGSTSRLVECADA
ncbi:MAG: hypothetical protein QM286_02955 [Acidobacteriota bacterium]|nr:hypothetical protein [Acidobacteriota bacterium]